MTEPELEDVGLTEVARPSDEEVERVYRVLLDALLMPPAAAENLIKTQTIDKKWQMIQMNQVQFLLVALSHSNAHNSISHRMIQALLKDEVSKIATTFGDEDRRLIQLVGTSRQVCISACLRFPNDFDNNSNMSCFSCE